MTIIYRVKYEAENFETILGKGQLMEFATQRVYENANEVKEKLSPVHYEPTDIRLANNVIEKVLNGEDIATIHNAKLLLHVLGYRIIEIKVY